MRGGSVAKRYATALLRAAEEQGQVPQVGEALEKLCGQIQAHAELKIALESPVLPASQKKQLLTALQQKLELGTSLQNLLQVLVDQDRMAILPLMFLLYQDMADAVLGRVRVQVESAVELGEQRDQLQKIFAKSLNKDVILETSVRPELIAGLVVKVGDRVFDASLKHDLENIKKSVLEKTV